MNPSLNIPLFELVKAKDPVCDILGNEIIRGQVIAYSKGSRGQRNLLVGVVSCLVPHGKGYSIHLVSQSEWHNCNHQTYAGIDNSIVILHNPLYSLNSKVIANLFENVESIKGKSHGDVQEFNAEKGPGYSFYRKIHWKLVEARQEYFWLCFDMQRDLIFRINIP